MSRFNHRPSCKTVLRTCPGINLFITGITVAILILSSPTRAENLKELSISQLDSIGTDLHSAGRFQESIEYFSEMIRRDPLNPLAFSSRGRVYASTTNLQAAIQDYTKAISILEASADHDPKVLAHLYHRRACVQTGEPGLNDAERALQLDPNYVMAMVTRGNKLEQLGRHEEAVQAYMETLRQDPENLLARTNLIHLALKAHDYQLASDSCDQWIALAEKVEQDVYGGSLEKSTLTTRIPVDSDPVTFYLNCGTAKKKLGLSDESNLFYSYASSSEARLASSFKNRGNARLNLNEFEGAVNDFDRALERRPNDAEVWADKGWALYKLARLDEAEVAYAAALQNDPKHFDAYANRAYLRADQGRQEEALNDASYAMSIDPEARGPILALAYVHHVQKNFDAASNEYNKIAVLEPNNTWLQSNRANALMYAGRMSEALQAFDIAVRSGSSDDFAGRAWTRRYLGDFWGALDDIAKSIEINPNSDYAKGIQAVFVKEIRFSSVFQLSSDLAAVLRDLADSKKTFGDTENKSEMNEKSPVKNALRNFGSTDTLSENYYYVAFGLIVSLLSLLYAVRLKKLSRNRDRAILLGISTCSIVLAGWFSLRNSELEDEILEWIKKPNRLISSTGVVSIPLTEPLELDGMTKAEVYEVRNRAVKPFLGTLIDSSYAPSNAVFRAIEDGRPWWGTEGVYFYGPGENSIDGPSEESRFLANPLLLVGLAEGHAYRTKLKPTGDTRHVLKARTLSRMVDGSFVARYSVAKFFQHEARLVLGEHAKIFTLSTYNARDLGFNYLTYDKENSKGLVVPATDQPVPLVQFIHKGGSCQYPGGCNNMSPLQPELKLKLDSVPAIIAIHLWRERPLDYKQKPDQVIRIEIDLW